MKKNKSVLIIGGFGFLGKSLSDYFALKQFEVSVIGKHEPERPFDIVINCGGKVHNASYKDLIESNTSDPTKYLLTYNKLNNNVKYLHIGSSSEYGTQKTKISEDSTICNPVTDYAITKYLGTLSVVNTAKTLNCNANVLRPFSVFGKYDNPNKFIPKIVNSVKNDTSIILYPGSHDWLYVEDFCKLCHLVVSSDSVGEVINAGTGVCTNNKEVLNCLFEVMQKKVNVIEKNELYRSYDTDHWVSDISKSKNLFQWTPEYTLKQGLYDLTNK